MSDMVFDPVFPLEVIGGVGLVLVIFTAAGYWRLGSILPVWQRLVLVVPRLAAVMLLLLVLLQPSRQEPIPPDPVRNVTVFAVDNSRSMMQKDTPQGSRLEAAGQLLSEAGVVNASGDPAGAGTRLYRFSDSAEPIKNSGALDGGGATTRFHTALNSILSSTNGAEPPRAIFVLSDGHDFELVNPAKTGFGARSRQVPIYAVAIGKTGRVRDVSVRIVGFQPYCYAKQKARVSAALRMVGCELEVVEVRLMRAGEIVQRKQVRAGDEIEQIVNFDVIEPATGQFEYEVAAVPLEGENDKANNRAITLLNVIDREIQVLCLEGEPYWDTSFLQRSLSRNEKMNVDSIVQYAPGKARSIRKRPEPTELKIPATAAEWERYDVVILGRSIEKLLSAAQVRMLESYVKDHGGVVIFSRGPAFGGGGGELAKNELEPVIWSTDVTRHVRLEPGKEGQSLAPFRLLADSIRSPEPPKELIAGRRVTERKPLAAAMALAQPTSGGDAFEGMVHRRLGEGQVFSVGLDGLWRWAFSAKSEAANTLYDRFWDQTILWLLAGRDFNPGQKYSFRASSANVPLGEKIHFRATVRNGAQGAASMPVSIALEGAEVLRTSVAAEPSAPDRLLGEFLPEKPGKYEAAIQLPDGTKEKVRFIVFDENLEQTEVGTDSTYLKRLCESSGGRLIEASELATMVKELHAQTVSAPVRTRLVSAWDRAWVFWIIGGLLALDWALRRRWGLA